ncbi:MAG: ATP-binding protein [Calditrichaeota bacterium]|nr:MAG: ATP-binding protein [Calditrichota bacterium]
MKSYKEISGDGGSNIVAQVTAQKQRLQAQTAGIRHMIAVMSGKGGVGKSSFTVNLASVLAAENAKVGILDADIHGPSIAKMAGVKGQALRSGPGGVQPAQSFSGIKVMSMDLFLPQDDAPVVWQAPTQKDAHTWRTMMDVAAVREFFSDTVWGELDFLLVDLPPGSDKLGHIVDLLPRLSGSVIVTLPSGVSRLVVGKSIKMATEILNTPVIGLVENMASYICPHCHREEPLFPGGQAEEWARAFGIPLLGKIPFDSEIARCADQGVSFCAQHRDSIAAKRYTQIANKIVAFLDLEKGGKA